MRPLIILTVPVCLVGCLQVGNTAEGLDDVLDYARTVLSKDYEPTVADFQRFDGHGSEFELEQMLLYCEGQGWIPVATSRDCISFVEERSINADSVISLYYARLRSFLPLDPQIELGFVEEGGDDGTFAHELVGVKLDATEIVFFSTLSEEHRYEFGEISISTINDVAVSELIEGMR